MRGGSALLILAALVAVLGIVTLAQRCAPPFEADVRALPGDSELARPPVRSLLAAVPAVVSMVSIEAPPPGTVAIEAIWADDTVRVPISQGRPSLHDYCGVEREGLSFAVPGLPWDMDVRVRVVAADGTRERLALLSARCPMDGGPPQWATQDRALRGCERLDVTGDGVIGIPDHTVFERHYREHPKMVGDGPALLELLAATLGNRCPYSTRER